MNSGVDQMVARVKGKKVASAATDESQSDKRERGSNWELEELVSMARAKAELHRESVKKPVMGQPFMSQEDRWTRVADHLVKDGFSVRTWTQCKNKWEGVQKEWKKFNKHISDSGGANPWSYDRARRRQYGLAYIFNEELYELVNESYGHLANNPAVYDGDKALDMATDLATGFQKDLPDVDGEDEEFVDESHRQGDREEHYVQLLYSAVGTSHKAKLPTHSAARVLAGGASGLNNRSSRSFFGAAAATLPRCEPQSAPPTSTTSEDQLEASTGKKRKNLQELIVASVQQTGMAIVEALNKWEESSGTYRAKRLELEERRLQLKETIERERLQMEHERAMETAKQLAAMNSNLAGLVTALSDIVKTVKSRD